MKEIKHIAHYQIQDFLEDEKFNAWVVKPNPDLNAYWASVLQVFPEQKQNIDEARKILLALHKVFAQNRVTQQEIAQEYRHFLEKANTISSKSGPFRQIQRASRYWLAAAAVCLLMIIGFWGLPDRNTTMVYQTGFGEWKVVILPDGSEVQLNADSRLETPGYWREGNDRVVHLKGEAFFTVTKKPSTQAKFTVVTPGIKVEVLGTVFNVNSRKHNTEVFLEEGVVRLRDGNEEKMIMQPGDLVRIDKENKIMVLEKVEKNQASRPTTWKDGHIFFSNEPMQAIFNRLSEIYGVAFSVADTTLLQKKYTLAVPMEKIETVQAIIQDIVDAPVNIRGE